MKHRSYLFLSLLIAALGCDKGLAPPPPQPSLEGKVRFLSDWPNKDSIRIMALALMEIPPPYTGAQILSGFGTVVHPIITSFTYGIVDTTFYFELDTGKYYYLGVAQQFGPDFNKDWRVLGFAHDALDSAVTFNIGPNDHIEDLVIDVRFDSLPRQPFVK